VDTSSAVEPTIVELCAGFAALGDPTRLRILHLLADDDRCVCDLRDAVDVAPNVLSYHLKVLRDAGLVTATRRGRWIDYALAPAGLAGLRAALPAPQEAALTR
jgi:ArsR family transcriptional regulator, arsenate/arsenite/antimonite-responsive transcriptional repressor